MKLRINASTRIRETQESFSDRFPYLKIEFYNELHRETELSSKENRIAPFRTISEVSQIRSEIRVDLDPDRTVADQEAAFYRKLGVGVQLEKHFVNSSLIQN